MSPGSILEMLLKVMLDDHFPLQALHEVHKILGQVDILGSPIVLSSNVVAGVKAFFQEPLKARNLNEFARGLGKGSMELIKFSAFGFLEAIGQARTSSPFSNNSCKNLPLFQ